MTSDKHLGRARISVSFDVSCCTLPSPARGLRRVPALKDQAGISNAELGLALFGMAAGLLAGTRWAHVPVDRFGSRRVLRVGIPLMAATLLLPALAHGWLALAAEPVPARFRERPARRGDERARRRGATQTREANPEFAPRTMERRFRTRGCRRRARSHRTPHADRSLRHRRGPDQLPVDPSSVRPAARSAGTCAGNGRSPAGATPALVGGCARPRRDRFWLLRRGGKRV